MEFSQKFLNDLNEWATNASDEHEVVLARTYEQNEDPEIILGGSEDQIRSYLRFRESLIQDGSKWFVVRIEREKNS